MTSTGALIFSAVMAPSCRKQVWKSNWSISLNAYTLEAGFACKRVASRQIKRLLKRNVEVRWHYLFDAVRT